MTLTTTRRRRTASLAAAARAAAEPLESRRLFAATLVSDIPDATGGSSSTQTVDLQPFFRDDANSVVRLGTTSGDVDVRTFDAAVPVNAANFIAYASAGRYDNSYFHRAIPDFVLQGGSFYPPPPPGPSGLGPDVPEFPPIISEPNGPRSNVRGTLAFARLGEDAPGGGPNSATSGFFFNLADNSANLDVQNGGFTVFGQVLGNGMTVVDALTAVAAVRGRETEARINTAALVDDVTYSVTSSDPAAVAASIGANNDLVLAYGNINGTSTITVTATDLDGATTVQDTFTATSVFDPNAFNVALGGEGRVRSASFTDATGATVTVSLSGPGAATLRFSGTGLAQTTARGRTTVTGEGLGLANVAVTGSDARTSVAVTSRGGTGPTTLGGLSVDGPVRAITGRGVLLSGTLTTGGPTGSVTLGGVNGGTLTLGGTATGRGNFLSLGDLTDATVTSAGPIRSLSVTSATDVDPAAGGITAPGVQAVVSRGDFGTNVVVPGEGGLGSMRVSGSLTGDVTAHAIGAINVRGDMTGSTVTATHGAGGEFADRAAANAKGARALGALVVRGTMTSVTVNAGGSIGTVSAGSMVGCRIVAGVPAVATAPAPAPVPAAVTELTEPSTLNALTVRGAFANTVVVARFIGKASVGSVTTANGGIPFGFAADEIGSLVLRTDAGQRAAVRRADDQADVDAALTGVPLTDAVVRVL